MLVLRSTSENGQKSDGDIAQSLCSLPENGVFSLGIAPTHRALYSLKCRECDLVFSAVVATSEDELLRPDLEVLAEQAGDFNAQRFNDFYWAHFRHGLDCVEVC